jgi:gluconolactonase
MVESARCHHRKHQTGKERHVLEKFSILVEGLDHPEATAWSPDGRLFAGGEAGQIYAVTLDGEIEKVADTGGFVLGLALDGAGLLYACDMARKAVMRVAVSSGEVEIYSSGTADDPLRAPNYPAFDGHGNLFVTDSGDWNAQNGLIFRITAEGHTTVWTREARRCPNGCCLSPAGDALYIVESTLPGISRIPIRDDGSAGPLELVAELPGTVPDGIAFDTEGRLYIACYRPDRIYRLSPAGQVELLVEDAVGIMFNQPTNLAFAGEALDRLVVANLGGWHLAIGDVGAVGAPLPYPNGE